MIKNKLVRLWRRLQNPDYTGTDRRPFLTGLSVGTGIAIGVVVATVSRLAALLTVVGVAGAVILRGYILPGTPALVDRLRDVEGVPQRHSPGWDPSRLTARITGRAITPEPRRDMSRTDGEQMLTSAGVIVREDAELHITDRFRQEWLTHIQTVRDDTQQASDLLASAYDVDSAAVDMANHDDGSVIVTVDTNRVGRWASDAALAADLTIATTLAQWIPTWVTLDMYQQVTLVRTVRSVLDACPGCGRHIGPLDRGGGAAVSDGEYISVTCADCGSDLGSLPNQ